MTRDVSVSTHGSADADSADLFLRELISDLYRATERREVALFRGMPLVGDAVGANEVLTNTAVFQKNYGLLGLVGENRFSANGADWTDRRRLTQPGYQTAARSENGPNIRRNFVEALEMIDARHAQSVEAAMLVGSASVFLSVFSLTMAPTDILDFFDRARAAFARLQFWSWRAPNSDTLRSLKKTASDLLLTFRNALDRSPGASALLKDWGRRGQDIKQFDPLHELMMNFFAGVETTTSALCWAIDRIGVNEAVQVRICEEMRRGQTSYLDCFIDETLRYFPPIPFIVRQATKDVVLGRSEISQGEIVLLSIVGVHRDPAFWDEPAMFDSARDAFLKRSYDRRAFIPFLTGPRSCGGARLARLELTEAIRAFLERYAVTTESPEIAFRYSLALRPDGWASVAVRRRA